jgi:type I restriction enzyme, R subunit
VIWSARPAPNGSYTLPPIEATGSGSVQEKQQAYRVEIIQKMNAMFEGRS